MTLERRLLSSPEGGMFLCIEAGMYKHAIASSGVRRWHFFYTWLSLEERWRGLGAAGGELPAAAALGGERRGGGSHRGQGCRGARTVARR